MEIKFSKEGFLEELKINKENIINSWGIETSDSSGFFSLNEKGCRQKIIEKKFQKTKNKIKGHIETKLPFSHWKIYVEEFQKTKNKIIRKNKLVCLEDSEFSDFVSRFRFKKDFIKNVEIGNKKLTHKKSNIYYQHPVKKVVLNLKSGGRIQIELNNFKTIGELKPVLYARDFKEEWIIHVRLFPVNPKIKQIRICRSWYNKAIPKKIAKPFLAILPLRKFLWYRGEKKGGFPLGAYGLVLGKKGEILNLETEFTYFPLKN